MTEHLHISSNAGIMTIRFNRPDKKNAFTVEMYEAMTAALVEAERDERVRVVLFSAAGDVFTAGNDLGDFLTRPPIDETSSVFRFLDALTGASLPLVTAVNGLAVGIGMTMLLHCDLVYASERRRSCAPLSSIS